METNPENNDNSCYIPYECNESPNFIYFPNHKMKHIILFDNPWDKEIIEENENNEVEEFSTKFGIDATRIIWILLAFIAILLFSIVALINSFNTSFSFSNHLH